MVSRRVPLRVSMLVWGLAPASTSLQGCGGWAGLGSNIGDWVHCGEAIQGFSLGWCRFIFPSLVSSLGDDFGADVDDRRH